jgi:hypothetical protein
VQTVTDGLTAARRSTGPAAVVVALLLVVAALSFGLSSAFAGIQRHAYDSGPAPSTVVLTARHTYQLSVPGGQAALIAAGANANQPQCSWSSGAGLTQPLTVTALPADSGAVNTVATFVAPMGGRVHIECAGWQNVFVDDADSAPFDRGGLFLVVGIVALTAGVTLGLATLYRSRIPYGAGSVAP